MTNDQTHHYKWPLPHTENLLSEDVERLRTTLNNIDIQTKTNRDELATALAEASAASAAADEEIKTALQKTRLLALAGL